LNNKDFKNWCCLYSEQINTGRKPSPLVMGILNVTPDSFSDGGVYLQTDAAITKAFSLIAEGADIIDIGGESSRPGASPVSLAEELQRVIPVIEGIRAKSDICISIDTTKPEIMQAAIAAGAGLVNDISALRHEGSLQLLAETEVPVCLMHMRGLPDTMQNNPQYSKPIVEEIKSFFANLIQQCQRFGLKKEQLLLDPGFGFGKTLSHNLQIIKQFDSFKSFQLPLILGVSRKSSIGMVLNKPVDERVIGGITLSVMSLMQGATILRTHDVKETKEAIVIVEAVRQEGLD
jgi:dihydropteroate synthase